MSLDIYQGRKHESLGGKSPMFHTAFRAGRTRADDLPLHAVRIGGFTNTHVLHGMEPPPGPDCQKCMATAARLRQWVERNRLTSREPPDHER